MKTTIHKLPGSRIIAAFRMGLCAPLLAVLPSAFADEPSAALKTLYSFTGDIDGNFPSTALLLASDGIFTARRNSVAPPVAGRYSKSRRPAA